MSLQDILGISGSDNAPKRHPLWAIIGAPTENSVATQPFAITSHVMKDKTATSLRLLLCETQSSLEKFSTQFQGLAKDVGRATVQIEETLKLVEDRQETAVGDLKSLLARSQATLMKSHDLAKDELHDLQLAQIQQSSKIDNLQHQIMTLTQQIGKIVEHGSRASPEHEILNQKPRLDISLDAFQAHHALISTHAARLEDLLDTLHHAKLSQTCCRVHSPVHRHSVQIQTEHFDELDTSQTGPRPTSPKGGTFQVCADPESTRCASLKSSTDTVDITGNSTTPQDGVTSRLEAHLKRTPIQQSRVALVSRSYASLPSSSSSPIASSDGPAPAPTEESSILYTETLRKRSFDQVMQPGIAIAATSPHPDINYAYEDSFPIYDSFGVSFPGGPSDREVEISLKRRKGNGGARRPVQRMIEQASLPVKSQE